MCLACEMAWMIALDEIPDNPPPGFPRPGRDDEFICEAPDEAKAAPAKPEGELGRE